MQIAAKISHWDPNYYIVMDKETGEYIPLSHLGRGGRGGSFMEPVKWAGRKETLPRLFHSKWSAQCFINSWKKGHWKANFRGEKPNPAVVAARQKRQLVILNVELTSIPAR